MGAYVYKVTGKIVKDSEGRPANLLAYAYKPCFYWDDSEYQRVEFQTGVLRANSYVRNSKNYTGRIVMEAGGFSLPYGDGSITDDAFDARECRAREAAA